MAVTTGSEDAWQRTALIEISGSPAGSAGTAVDVQAFTETIDIDMGERDLDKIDLLNLGQIPKHGAVGITTVTFECYPLQAGTDGAGAATGVFDIFASHPAVDASAELNIDMTTTLARYRVAILWTDDSTADQGSDAVADTSDGMRFVMADCFCTSCKTTFTDGILKQTLTFKGVCFDKAADPNIKMESNVAEAMTALDAYTPSTGKWA